MAELQETASDVVYRPLSGLALAGFALSCLFGGVVVLSAGIAIFQGAPFFFPNWTLFLAAAGFVVSWCGLSDVRNSEGTKAGQQLATYGMWISLVSGTGYFAYSYFTGLALSQQAMAFLTSEQDGFFTHLRHASRDNPTELNRAFLLTLPPSDRNVDAADDAKMVKVFDKPGKDEAPGNLTRFRTDQLVLAVTKGGKDVALEPLGISGWKYEQRSYHVACLFRMKTREASAEIGITVRSAEGEAEGQSRQWFVDMTNYNHKMYQRTLYGEGMSKLRMAALGFEQSLEQAIRETGAEAGVGDFARLDKTDWARLDAQAQQQLKPRLQGIFDRTDTSQVWHFQPAKDAMISDWEFDRQGRLTLVMPLFLVVGDSKQQFATRGELSIALQTKYAVDPERFGAADSTDRPEWELKYVKAVRWNTGGVRK